MIDLNEKNINLINSLKQISTEDLEWLEQKLNITKKDNDKHNRPKLYLGVTPIGASKKPTKKNPNPQEEKSRRDYLFEKNSRPKNSPMLWDNTKANSLQSGNMFAFLHQSAQENQRVEIHYIEEVDNCEPRRLHWEQNNRTVLTLSTKFIDLPIKVLKSWMVSGDNYNVIKEKYRIIGTSKLQLDPRLKFNIQIELADRKNQLANVEARIWNISDHPIDNDIFNIVLSVASTINANSNKIKFFDNQIFNASVAIQMLLDKNSFNRAILGADTQSGKTGTSELISQSIRLVLISKNIIKDDEKIAIGFIQHISDTNLKEQTLERICDGFSFSYYKDSILKSKNDENVFSFVEMLSGGANDRISNIYEKIINDYKCSKVILISDEVQSAMSVGQQISTIFKKLEISANSVNENIYLLGVTATPNRYYNQLSDGYRLTLFWGQSGESYYGIQNMIDGGKIHHFGDFGTISQVAFENHIKPFIKPNSYILVRINSQNKNYLQKWENFAKTNNIRIEEFDCDKKNISSLKTYLQQEPKWFDQNNIILLVKMSVRAGVTLDNIGNISIAVDCFSGEDSVIQSFVGRFCGNQPNRKQHCPHILTNKVKVENYINDREYLIQGIMPKIKQSKIKKAAVGNTFDIKCVDVNSSEFQEHKEQIEKTFNKKFGANYCDKQNKTNLANEILNNRWDEPLRSIGIQNKSSSNFGKFDDDIKKLVDKYPNLIHENYVLIAKQVTNKPKKIGDSELQKTVYKS